MGEGLPSCSLHFGGGLLGFCFLRTHSANFYLIASLPTSLYYLCTFVVTILIIEVVCVCELLAGSLIDLHALVEIGHDDSTQMTILAARIGGRVRLPDTETGITAAAAFSRKSD